MSKKSAVVSKSEPPPPWVTSPFIEDTTYCRYCETIEGEDHDDDCWWNNQYGAGRSEVVRKR